jgi:hypothetical protein
MFVPEIIEVKDHLENLKNNGIVAQWELPYENLLTRRSAAIFFLTPVADISPDKVWQELEKYSNFSYRPNTEQKLSTLQYRVTFSSEELEKNLKEANKELA